MFPYIILLLYILYAVHKYDILKNRGYRDTAYWSLCLLFILFAGLRYRIGGDTLGYMVSWEYYPNIWDFNWINDIERCKDTYPDMERYGTGWFLYVMFLRGIWSHHLMIQFINAILLNYAIFRTIKKYSSYPFITILIFYLNFKFLELEFEVMRESVAISIYLLLAFDNYINRKWGKYYIGTLIAYLIHPSAVFMFLLPIIRNLDFSLFKNTIIFFIPPIVIAIAGRVILGDLINILFNSDQSAAQYMVHATEKEYNSNYIVMYIFQPAILYMLVAFFYNRIRPKLYVPLIFFALFFLNLSLLYFTASRLVNYIMLPVYIGITPIFYNLAKKLNTILVIPIFLLMYSIPFLFEFSRSPESSARYFPYQNYIFPNRTPVQKEIDKGFNF